MNTNIYISRTDSTNKIKKKLLSEHPEPNSLVSDYL